MSLETQLTSALTRLIGYSSQTPHSATLSAGNQVSVEIDFLAVDSMSCSVNELRVNVPALIDAEFDVLKKWSEALCGRVTYLMENIGPLEFSPDAGEVLIRSTPPDKQPGITKFYEVILKSHRQGQFSLRRYQSQKSQPGRVPVDIQTTHETLRKLVIDLVDTIPSA
jgi:hypothetical protein